MVKCGYCGGLGSVLLLGIPGPMCCPYCHGRGKIGEELQEEATREGDKRRAEPVILLFLAAIGVLLFVVFELMFYIFKFV